MFAHAEVHRCAIAFRYGSGVLLGNLLHEMGHAVGLGHYPGDYAGHRQVVNPYLDLGSPLTSYQLGDQHGLQHSAAWTRQFATEYAPTGHADTVTAQPDGSCAITGWALPGRESTSAGSWTLSEEGRTVSSGTATEPGRQRPQVCGQRGQRLRHRTPALPGRNRLWCLTAVDPAPRVRPWLSHTRHPVTALCGQPD
jgi:hypothetical protein